MQEHNNVGFYRDDDLDILRTLSRPNVEKKKKQIIKIFKRAVKYLKELNSYLKLTHRY